MKDQEISRNEEIKKIYYGTLKDNSSKFNKLKRVLRVVCIATFWFLRIINLYERQ